MKNGYVDDGGLIFADLSSGKSDTEENDDKNDVSLHEKSVTPEKVRKIPFLVYFEPKKLSSLPTI